VTLVNKYIPGYVKLHNSGELKRRVGMLGEMLKDCIVCPHQCHVNRTDNKRGFCRAGSSIQINSYGAHYGEEDILVGTGGSGTIFFSCCTLKCVFCQNCEISQNGEGYEISPEELSNIMLSLQKKGCHNINLVSPTHFVPQIIEAISIAAQKGLILPIVYNTGGYDDLNTLKLLDCIIDIYMPDIKFGDNYKAKKYTGSEGYYDIVRIAVKEMHRQVGDLVTDESGGLAVKGLLVRHLVMPNNIADTHAVLKFIADEISLDTVVNMMAQYYPAHKANTFPELARRITGEEFAKAVQIAQDLGLRRIIAF
jgi:putative pyruvate formate lyase activating enzyme